MADKPQTAQGYPPEQIERVRSTCLTIAVALGDMREDVVVVGGFAPMLLVPQDPAPGGVLRHVGTLDLDLGLDVAILDDHRYAAITARLRDAGFSPDLTVEGRATRQRWRSRAAGGTTATVDFLIPPSRPGDRGGTIRNIEGDFAALVTPDLQLAFRDRLSVSVAGVTADGAMAERMVQVCGPGAYIVLKALAFDGRGAPKDAYDLFYVVRNYGSGVEEVARHLARLQSEPEAAIAISVLRRDFCEPAAAGPSRVARFMTNGLDPGTQADVAGNIRQLLRLAEGEVV